MNERNHSVLRLMIGAVLPSMTFTSAMLPLWLFRERLPSPLATHWNFHGPNGAMSLRALSITAAVMAGAAALVMATFAYRRHATRGGITGPLAIAGFVAGLMAVVSWLTVNANLDVASWHAARPLGFGRLVLALGAGGLLAVILARVARPLESTTLTNTDVPHAGIAPGARAVWVSGASAAWAYPLVAGGLALALFAYQFSIAAALICMVVSAVGVFFTSIRMTVDRSGARIAYGLFGWPVQRVQLSDIQQATVLQVEPMAWGGWGYRGSLRMMRRAAVVLRRGEGMKLELTGDRVLAITIDNAAEGAGVINDLVAAQAVTGKG